MAFKEWSGAPSDPDKLIQDLAILEAMAAEMDTYLREDVLFWHMMKGDLPMLTLGGYLLRQHRLLALQAPLLTPPQRARLTAAVAAYQAALVEKVVRFETKAQAELAARLRQWAQFLSEGEWRQVGTYHNYATAVEIRAMMAALGEALAQPPHRNDARLTRRTAQLDRLLQGQWESGPFVWPPAWQPAYPPDRYWWLYGRPR